MKKEERLLAKNKDTPHNGNAQPLVKNEVKALNKKLPSGWGINKSNHLYKEYKFPNFIDAMKFANHITKIAETENHHPNLYIRWGLCACEIWTHSINNLSEKDISLAIKIEQLTHYKAKNE